MNKIMITGNLTNDMEVTTTKTTDIGNFVIANNRGFGDNQRTSFIRCTLFGKRVESMESMLVKGAKVLINGELEVTSDKQKDGTFKNYTNIIIDEIEIIKFVNDIEEDEEEEEKPKKGKKKARK